MVFLQGVPRGRGAACRGRQAIETPSCKRIMSQELHIGLFGRRNQGKSSLINLLTGQQVSIVSEKPGTTTDPVKKACEVFGIGKCVFIDTAGFDDAGELGQKRVGKTKDMVLRMDAGILLVSGNAFTEEDKAFANYLQEAGVPFLIVHNKSDETPLSVTFKQMLQKLYPACTVLDFSIRQAFLSAGTVECPYQAIAEALTTLLDWYGLVHKPVKALGGLVRQGDIVVLVCPVDAEAPKDRLILPQVMMARQCLDFHAMPILCQTEDLLSVLSGLAVKPALVITDSQVFKQVAEIVPEGMPLTSFSICLARQKGHFEDYLRGSEAFPRLKDGDKILMLESCTHQVNCHDIGRFKLPAALKKTTGKELSFAYVSGLDPLPAALDGFALAVQCGGCMVSDRQLSVRVGQLIQAEIPVCNYGMALAWCSGILARATEPFAKSL